MSTEPSPGAKPPSTGTQVLLLVAMATVLAVLAFAAASIVNFS